MCYLRVASQSRSSSSSGGSGPLLVGLGNDVDAEGNPAPELNEIKMWNIQTIVQDTSATLDRSVATLRCIPVPANVVVPVADRSGGGGRSQSTTVYISAFAVKDDGCQVHETPQSPQSLDQSETRRDMRHM